MAGIVAPDAALAKNWTASGGKPEAQIERLSVGLKPATANRLTAFRYHAFT
jgi:hypothetical protein